MTRIPRWRIAQDRMVSPLHVRALTAAGVTLRGPVVLHGRPIVSMTEPSQIVVGTGASLVSSSHWTALGVSHPVVLRTLRAGAAIDIGDDTGISGATICAALSVTIGKRVLIGADCAIFDTDFHPTDPVDRRWAPIPEPQADDGVRICDDVFIGARSLILKGVTIGRGSVVAAGSVVTRDVPDSTVVGGNPASALHRPTSTRSR